MLDKLRITMFSLKDSPKNVITVLYLRLFEFLLLNVFLGGRMGGLKNAKYFRQLLHVTYWCKN